MTLPEALGRLLEAGRLPHAVLLQGAQPPCSSRRAVRPSSVSFCITLSSSFW